MNRYAIEVEGLSKCFQLQTGPQSTGRLSHDLVRAAGRIGRWFQTGRQTAETLWAVNDVSFKVERGEAIGLIGANGSGKSTLLKMLARITEPSKGWFSLSGRVASLLEVGIGFHGEPQRSSEYLSVRLDTRHAASRNIQPI